MTLPTTFIPTYIVTTYFYPTAFIVPSTYLYAILARLSLDIVRIIFSPPRVSVLSVKTNSEQLSITVPALWFVSSLDIYSTNNVNQFVPCTIRPENFSLCLHFSYPGTTIRLRFFWRHVFRKFWISNFFVSKNCVVSWRFWGFLIWLRVFFVFLIRRQAVVCLV